MTFDRNSLIVKVAREFQCLPIGWLRFLEKPFLSRQLGNDRRNIIILFALPRSGSTLTYQSIIHSIHATYLSNFSNLLFQLPLIGGKLSSFLCAEYQSDFTSAHGFISGLCGPAEGLKFWSYWLGCDLDERYHIEIDEQLLSRRSNYINSVLSCLGSSESPVVTGYLGHTLVPQYVQAVFSGAVYVRLHRDPVSNALSILKSRNNTSPLWFSLFPQECNKAIGKGKYNEVAAQVYWLNRRLDDALIGDNVFHLDYEDLCGNPREKMEELVMFCNKRGMSLSVKSMLPKTFKFNVAKLAGDTDAINIRIALNDLEHRYGKLQR